MEPRSPARMKKRRLIWISIAVLGIGIMSAVVWELCVYPRQVLMSDVRHSNSIIVRWHSPGEDGRPVDHAFELNKVDRVEFTRTLTEELGVDYLPRAANVVPMINVYVDNGSQEEFVATYAIRRARGGGPSSSIEVLRGLASKGRPLTAKELADLDQLKAKWPRILPWDAFPYDFVVR